MNEPRPVSRRRRHGRRLVRLLLWGTAALALLVLFVWWLSGTPWVKARALRLAEARLEETLGREVRVGDLDYRFRPFVVVAEDVVIPGPDRPQEEGAQPPFARAPRVEVELSFSGLFRPVLTVERVDLERPEVWMLFYPDGTDNLPDLKTGQGGGRMEVRIGRMNVEDGTLHFEQREIPLDLEAAPVRAMVEGPAASPRVEEDQLVATVVVGDLAVGLPEARRWGGSASARVVIGPGRLDVTGGRLRGPDLAADFQAVYRFGDEADREGTRGGEVEVSAVGSASLANRLGYLEETLSGPFEVTAEVALAPGGTTYRGTATSAELRFADRRFREVEAAFSGGDEGLVVEVVEAEHAGGAVAATLTLPAVEAEDSDEAGRPAVVEASGEGLRLASLVADLGLEDTFLGGLRGRAAADLLYRFRTDAALAGDGDGVVRLAGVERPGETGRLPVSGRVPLQIRDGVVTIADAVLTAPGQRLAVSGSYDLEAGSGRFQYRLDSERLGRLAEALPLPAELTAEGVPAWLPTGGTGTVRGEIELRPGGGYSVEAATELAAVETALGRIDRLAAPITLEDGLLLTEDLVLEGQGQRLILSGRYDLETREVAGDFRLTSDDLGRLAEILPVEGERPPWLPRGGDGRVEGDLTLGADGLLTGRARLDLEDVALAGLTLEELSGSFRLEPGAVRDLRLEATTDGGALIASGSAPLPPFGDAAATPDWQGEPFDLALDAADWPLESLPALVPGLPELAGAADVEAEIAGTFRDPRGRVLLTVEPLSVAGVAVDRAAADLRLDGPRLVVDSLRVAAPAGTVLAEGAWNRETGGLDLRLESAEGLALSEPPLAGLVPGELAGRVAFTADVGGTLDEPRVTVDSTARGLRVAGRELGEDGRASLQATWTGREVDVEGSILGIVDVTGGGLLTTEAVDVDLGLEVEDVDGLLRMAAGAPLQGLSGALAGRLAVDGRFDSPSGPDVALRLDPVRLSYQEREIYNLEPVVVRYEPGRLVVDSLFLGVPEEQGGGELFVTGSVGLEGERPLDLRLQADLSAAWAELVLEDYQLAGRIQALATVRGTVADPAVNGQGGLSGGQVILPDFPHALENVDAIALFYPDRIVLDSATARLGGGRVRAEGRVALAGLPGGDPDYRFQVRVRDSTIRYPEGFLLRGGGDVTLTTTPDGRLISGVVELDRAFYLEDVPVGVTQLLADVFEPTRLEAGAADPEAAATQLNLSIQGPGALRVRNNVADLSGDVDLVVRGSVADPALFGRVEVAEGGQIVYAENEYRVDRGLLTFANPYRIDPVIDLVATTEVRNYDITLNLAGTLDDLEASFNSDPPLADLEVVSLLTVGRPIESGAVLSGTPGAEGGTGGAAGAAEQLLYGQAASLVAERVSNLFGLDRFRVSPSPSGASSLAFTVGQQISRDLFVTYSRDPVTPEQDFVQVEWQAYENVLLVLTRRDDDTYILDVQVERRF